MAIRNNKLGGNDYVNGEVLEDFDLDDTNNAIINFAAKGQAQTPFSILKDAGAFTNEGNLAADRVTDSNGVNNTINLGSTNAFYNSSSDKYVATNSSDLASGDTTTSNSFSDVVNTFDGNDSTYATMGSEDSGYIGKTFSEKYISNVYYKVYITVDDAGAYVTSYNLQYYDGTSWNNLEGSSVQGADNTDIITSTYSLNMNVQGLRIKGSTDFGGQIRAYTLEYYEYNTSSTLIVDSNTLNLSGNENSLVLYNPSTIPTNTNIKATLNDGVQNISAETTLSENDATTIPLTTTPTAGNLLQIHYTLETTDSSTTPEWYGYGVYKY